MASRGPIPAANYISIDAVSSKTVTRKTLLRYMVKSQRVNILLLAFLWSEPKNGFYPESLVGTQPAEGKLQRG